jgi:hypothetical protein
VKRAEDLQKRQKESITQLKKEVETEKSGNERRFQLLSSAIDKLKDKLAGGTPMTCGTEVTRLREVTDAVHGSLTPPPSANLGNMARIENVSCNCNLNSCATCVDGGAICESATDPVRSHSANGYLSYADFPVPQFDDSSEVNLIFHLNQLDEFMRLRCVPKPI